MGEYEAFVASKLSREIPTGIPDAIVWSPHLMDFQRDLVQWSLRRGRAAVFADTGLGKEQPVTEPVLTPSGWRTMGDLRAGDFVVGSDGKPTEVLGVFPQGIKRVLRIVFSDGSFVRCGADHLWAVRTKVDKYRNNPYRVLSTRDIADSVHREWQVPIGVAPEMTRAELPIDPYALGVLLGDGSLFRSGENACTDNWIGEHLGWEKIRAHGSTDVGYWKPTKAQKHAILALGLRGTQSDTKFVPAQFLTAAPDQRHALLQGLMDTDGYAMPDGGAEFSSTSHSLIEAVMELVRSLGGVARGLREAASFAVVNGERRPGKQAWRVNVKLPAGMAVFRLPRKRDAYVEPTKYHPTRIIRDVIDEGVCEEQVCIMVAAADSLYVTRGHVLTHNSRIALMYARMVAEHVGKPVVIVCPLSVARQFVEEGAKVGVTVLHVREREDAVPHANRPVVMVTNYERLHKLDASMFGGVVLDESSIIKNKDSKTLRALTESFASTPFRLCLTATPSPNDYVELGTHAEFLGVCTQTEMLAEFFVHDGGETQKWRLKGHARTQFWRWVATWAAMLRSPADLGYDASAYALPTLHVRQHVVPADADTVAAMGLLFSSEAKTLMERRAARKASISARVKMCADLVASEPEEPWIVWCELNAESEALADVIPGAVEVTGALDIDEKEARIWSFVEQRARVVVGKTSIFGFGLNLQHCARMAFVGVSDSWESYYQAVRRCYRFGQKREVHVHLFASEAEGAVLKNLKRKEEAARAMSDELSAETRDAVRAHVRGTKRTVNAHDANTRIRIPTWMREGA